MATRSARSVDRTVDQMLRQMAKTSKAGAGSSGSSSTAAQALAQMAEIQKRIARGDTDAAQFLIDKVTANVEVTENPKIPLEKLRALRPKKNQFAWRNTSVLIATFSVFFVLIGIVGGYFVSRGGHSVSGKVLFNNEAARSVELVFYSISQGNVRITTLTEHDGAFTVASLPAGDYKVFLNKAADVPQSYLSPLSTPLRLKLHDDLENVTFSVSSSKKRGNRKI